MITPPLRSASRLLRPLFALLWAALLPLPAAVDAPVSPHALPEVGALLRFLHGIEGQYLLSGQQEIAWDERRAEEDVDYLFRTTGRYPAVRGFDFLQYTKSDSARAEQRSTDRALAWARRGGIVTYCVHLFMRAGSNDGTNPHFYVPAANNGKGTTVDIRHVVLAGTPEHAEFIQKLDLMAAELKRLRDARVPVIWRPLHECSGGWFWWGANGPEAFKQAWRIMFTRFTELHGLTNLIWCYNPTTPLASNLPDWYPGDDVVDMISLDVYPAAGTHPTYAADYARMRDFRAGRKAVAMSENGAIPDPDRFFTEGAGWSYFCTWNGFENDLSRNSVDFIRRVFAHEKVITLDELPALFQARAYTLVTQPVPQLVVAGQPLALAVSVRSDGPLAYQPIARS